MSQFAREQRYVMMELEEEYGRAYSVILSRMSRLEFQGRDLRTAQTRLLKAKLDGFQQSAVIVLLGDDYNGIDNEAEAEKLLKTHRALFHEAIEKDEKEKEEAK
ncbi:hypothetical protein [Streptomyces sp. NPDC004682]